MSAADVRRLRKQNAARTKLKRLGWYHSFRFEDGTEFQGVLPVEVSEHRYSKFPIPKDLTGKRVLDIGAWDGWFSFEAERHGAEVTAIDMVEMPNFWTVHRRLSSRVTYKEVDLFDLPSANLGTFDYVFFLGVLYHTKYPVLALELVCGAAVEMAIVESYVIDADNWEQHRDEIPSMEFYEAEELGGQLDNWCGPTVGCLVAMCRAAGFARTEILEVGDNRAALACYRTWIESPQIEATAAPTLRSVTNTIRLGKNFKSKREEYLTWWFESSEESLHRDEVRLKVGQFGVPAMYVSQIDETLWSANSRLPPGLDPGWYEVRISVHEGSWSQPLRIAVDLEPLADSIHIDLICDGRTWTRGRVALTPAPAHISLWVTGLGETCDEANTTVLLDAMRLKVTYISASDEKSARQVNAEFPSEVGEGLHQVVVKFGGSRSMPGDLLVRQST